MGSGTCGDNLQKFSPTSPHFFKIILEETLVNNKLRIPQKFLRKYGDDLTSPVFLRLPCGLEWKVGLEKCDGKVWMEKGWQEFADYYSLVFGQLLVFRYELNSKFHVCIFDTSTAEIDYPSNVSIREEETKIKDEDEDEDSVEILDSIYKTHNSRLHKRLKTCLDHGESHLRSKGKCKMVISEENTGKEDTMWPSCSRVRRASKEANKFFSTNPYFQVALRSNHFYPIKSKVHIPAAFARTHFGERTQTMKLQVGERSWPVKLLTYPSEYAFSGGWGAFVRENSLCPKDVLRFELIKSKSVVLKVSIFSQQ